MPRHSHGTETITIAGHAFEAPLRYAEGHELTVGEASQLNQVFHENLRNNFSKKVKDAIESGAFDHHEMQKSFNEYAHLYEMGVRVATGSRDPVKAEAMAIAKGIIKTALKRRGQKIVHVEASAITAAAQKLLDKGDDRANEIWATARKRVEEAQLAAGGDLGDLISDLPTKSAEDHAQAAE